MIFAGANIGRLIAETKGDLTIVNFDYKDNGRGPTVSETIRTGPGGPGPDNGVYTLTQPPARG